MLVKNVNGEAVGASMVRDSEFYIELAKFVQAYTLIINNPNEFLAEVGENSIDEKTGRVTWEQLVKIISKCDFDASNITLPNGQKMTIIKTDMYKLKTEWVEVFAACINDVFYALVKFFEFCDIKMCLRNADGNNIGVILFEKK